MSYILISLYVKKALLFFREFSALTPAAGAVSREGYPVFSVISFALYNMHKTNEHSCTVCIYLYVMQSIYTLNKGLSYRYQYILCNTAQLYALLSLFYCA